MRIVVELDFNMEVKSDNILEIQPNAVEYIRSKYNLREEERLEEVLNILREWIKSQPHFRKKDFRKFISKYIVDSRIS